MDKNQYCNEWINLRNCLLFIRTVLCEINGNSLSSGTHRDVNPINKTRPVLFCVRARNHSHWIYYSASLIIEMEPTREVHLSFVSSNPDREINSIILITRVEELVYHLLPTRLSIRTITFNVLYFFFFLVNWNIKLRSTKDSCAIDYIHWNNATNDTTALQAKYNQPTFCLRLFEGARYFILRV